MKSPTEPIPLCVDLDGTLIHTDSVLENLLKLIRTKPWQLFLLPAWLMRGRAYLQHKLVANARLNPATLAYRRELVDYLKIQVQEGRPLILATAADSNTADDVANHLGLFSGVVASDGQHNMKSEYKRAQLEQLFGPGNYDYVGDSRADIPVWDGARKALAVGVSSRELKRWERSTPIELLVKPANRRWRDPLPPGFSYRLGSWLSHCSCFSAWHWSSEFRSSLRRPINRRIPLAAARLHPTLLCLR